MSVPQVSVIIASYNYARYLPSALDSVLSQTFQDFEIILVDDGSTDESLAICERYASQYPSLIQLYTHARHANKGMPRSWNLAIEKSRGKYIAFLGADDIWLAHKLERQVQVFAEFPNVSLVYSLAYTIDAEGNFRNNRETIGKPVAQPQRAVKELIQENSVPALTASFRRSWIEKKGGFDESLEALADWDLWLRIAADAQIFCVPEPLALYRIHGANSYSALVQSRKVATDWLVVLKKVKANLAKDNPDAAEVKSIIWKRYRQIALDLSYSQYYRGNYAQAKKYLFFALKFQPALLKEDRANRLLAKLLLGERGTQVVKSMKSFWAQGLH